MTGWILSKVRTQCALCGHWAEPVWRYFATDTTSTMHVCTTCADALHTSSEQERP